MLPYTIHSQANSSPIKKYSSKKRIGYIGDDKAVGFKLCIGDEVVAFNHHVKHENELAIKDLKKKIRSRNNILIFLLVLLIVAVAVVFK